jgi:hypothetical protein
VRSFPQFLPAAAQQTVYNTINAHCCDLLTAPRRHLPLRVNSKRERSSRNERNKWTSVYYKRGRTFSAAAPGVQKEESLFSNHSFQQLSFALISSKEKKNENGKTIISPTGYTFL